MPSFNLRKNEEKRSVESYDLQVLSEIELSMMKLESVREVLFQALLLDDVKFEDGKMYAELCSVYLLKKE